MSINSCLLSSTCLKNKILFFKIIYVYYASLGCIQPSHFSPPYFFWQSQKTLYIEKLTAARNIEQLRTLSVQRYWEEVTFIFLGGNITLTDTFLFIPTGFKFKFQNSSLSQSNLFIATAYFHVMHMLVSISKILV